MNFSQTVQEICRSAGKPLTPQEIRDQIKASFPEHYRTSSHLRNVEKGHYKDVDHALLAQIYIIVRQSKHLYCDTTQKPMLVSWASVAKKKLVEKSIRPTTRSKSKVDFAGKVKDILENSKEYHHAYYMAETFSGPSLYFHQRALETRHSPRTLIHNEYVYATLASWGMHRLGQKGSKMKGFSVFRQSIETLNNEIIEAQNYTDEGIRDQEWELLKRIFFGLEVMETSISLVGNSKVMHHLLPNIIPPIDREYTLRFLYSNKTIVSNLEKEWSRLQTIVRKFFIPIVSDKGFQQQSRKWQNQQDLYPWDTSPMKIVDNLVIGAVKSNKE